MIHPYATEAYARSLSHWGEALHVPEWDCHVITHETAGGADAAGMYPLAVIPADADLAGGLERLRRLGMISLTLVLDDFHRPPLDELRRHFQLVNRFKTHQVRRTGAPFAYGKHHRYEVRRALKKVAVRPFDLAGHAAEWSTLYAALTQRRALAGVHDFPASHYDALYRLDGTTSIGAWLDDELVCAHIWVSDGKYVHSHLGASSSAGYAAGAAYAVYDASIRHFAGAELLNLGGGAGLRDDPGDGLASFKRGFANESAAAYICGAVLDPVQYDRLVRQTGVPPDTLFFPAYRARTG
jgi:hypothetical protein